MASDPRIRASDQDRDRTADLLREHHAVGRLDAAEFNDRLDKVFEARTIGELDELTADLPAIDLYPLPTSSLPRISRPSGDLPSSLLGSVAAGHGHGRFSPAWLAAWGSWLGLTLLLTVIWVVGGAGYPWPLWVIGPLGAILAGRWIMGTRPGGHGHAGSGHGQVGGGTGGRGELGRGPDEIGGGQDQP